MVWGAVHAAPVDRRVLAGLAAAALAVHLLAAPGYGYFRDELYYLACARHLDLGYVDHPPLVAWIAALVRATLGESLLAIRGVSALAAAATVWTAGATAAELGGRRFAQALAATATLVAPVYLALASVFSMNPVDLLLWACAWRLAARALRPGSTSGWLGFGAVIGLGLLNKLSPLFLAFGVTVGLLAGRRWDVLRDRSWWAGAAFAIGLAAPHLAWQWTHGFPTREFIANAQSFKNLELAPAAFLGEQAMQVGPWALPLWLGGLIFFLRSRAAAPWRALGWAYLAVLAVMLLTAAKPYYLAPAYTVLFAGGAVALERRLAGTVARAAILALMLVAGAATAPLAMPLLPVDTYVRYAAALGLAPGTDERHAVGRLPQFFADMHGWPEFAAAFATAYRQLPAEDQARACVVGNNYGEAGALDLFGPALGLPPAISAHNNYFLWGPRGCSGAVLLVAAKAEDRARLAALFAEVTPVGRFDCADCMPYERDQTIWLARGPRVPLAELWPTLKHYE